MQPFQSPDEYTILQDLIREPHTELTSNIKSDRVMDKMVNMTHHIQSLNYVYRNLPPEAKKVIQMQIDMIAKQKYEHLKARKAVKGYTTNKVIEALVAKISRTERALRSVFNKRDKDIEATSK